MTGRLLTIAGELEARPEVLRRLKAFADLESERLRQDAKWGEQNHGATVWLTVLTEEVGELAQAVLWLRGEPGRAGTVAEVRAEAVQVAAVALAMVEWVDRGCPIDGTDRAPE